MGKSGTKLDAGKASKIRRAIRAVIKENRDLQAAVSARRKAAKGKNSKANLRSAITKVVSRNPLLQQAAKDIFNNISVRVLIEQI
jgi:predicted DNA-binding protein